MNEFNILVVDDAFFMRMLLKKTLNNKPKSKYKFNIVSEAQDGKEGLDLYKLLKTDIVTLDINMPKVNGLEFLKKVRKINPNVHCIIISTTKNEEVRAETKKDNVYYLPKSFQPEYFYKLLDEIAINIIKEKQNYIHKNENGVVEEKSITTKQKPLQQEPKKKIEKPKEIIKEVPKEVVKEKPKDIAKEKPKEVFEEVIIKEPIKEDVVIEVVKDDIKESLKEVRTKEETITVDIEKDFELAKLPEVEEESFKIDDEQVEEDESFKIDEEEDLELPLEFLYDYDKEMEELENEINSKNNTQEVSVIKSIKIDDEDNDDYFDIDEDVQEEPEIKELDDLDLDLLKLKQDFDFDIKTDNTEKKEDSSLKMELKEPIDTYNIKNKQQEVIIPPPKRVITKEVEVKTQKKEDLANKEVSNKKSKKSWSLFDFIFRRNKKKK